MLVSNFRHADVSNHAQEFYSAGFIPRQIQLELKVQVGSEGAERPFGYTCLSLAAFNDCFAQTVFV